MGTPETKLEFPVGRQLELLQAFRDAGKGCVMEDLPKLLELTRELLASLVQWLDKDVYISSAKDPAIYRPGRAMVVFDGEMGGFGVIAISRDSRWLIKHGSEVFFCVTSAELADYVRDHMDELRTLSPNYWGLQNPKLTDGDLAFLKPLVKHLALKWMFTQMADTVLCTIQQRQERYEAMRSLATILGSASEATDPLKALGRMVRTTYYSISLVPREVDLSSSASGTFLDRSAVDSLHKEAVKRNEQGGGGGKYELQQFDVGCGSIGQFLHGVACIIDQIETDNGQVGDISYLGRSGRRPPLTPPEIACLKRVASDIMKG